MKSFYLVRHGDIDNPRDILYGRLPLKLSTRGEEQIGKMGDYFRDKDIAHIYSSPVLRCKQTSDLLAQSLRVPVTYDQRLLELLTVMQGMTWDEVATLPQDADVFQFVSELGGEHALMIRDRMKEFFVEKTQQDEDSIIVCSHGHPLHLLYLDLSQQPIPQDSRKLSGPQYQPVGSVRPIHIEGDKYQLLPIVKC